MIINFAVVTVSDSRSLENDHSGSILAEAIVAAGHKLCQRVLVPDATVEINKQIELLLTDKQLQVIIFTGGTGITARDVTPEAVNPLFSKQLPGFGELFRVLSFNEIGTTTIQSRATAGLIGKVFVFCLPGSPAAVQLAWQRIIAPQFDANTKPASFIDLLEKL